MLELLGAYSLKDILTFIILLLFAIQNGGNLFDWFKGKYDTKFNKAHNKLNKEQALEAHYKRCSEQHQESIQLYQTVDNKIDMLSNNINIRLKNLEDSINTLTMSDMHDIKGWIVEKHHSLIKQKWVDDFTMDTLEKRFIDYKKEGGNSYVKGLMNEMRALPHTPPVGED